MNESSEDVVTLKLLERTPAKRASAPAPVEAGPGPTGTDTSSSESPSGAPTEAEEPPVRVP